MPIDYSKFDALDDSDEDEAPRRAARRRVSRQPSGACSSKPRGLDDERTDRPLRRQSAARRYADELQARRDAYSAAITKYNAVLAALDELAFFGDAAKTELAFSSHLNGGRRARGRRPPSRSSTATGRRLAPARQDARVHGHARARLAPPPPPPGSPRAIAAAVAAADDDDAIARGVAAVKAGCFDEAEAALKPAAERAAARGDGAAALRAARSPARRVARPPRPRARAERGRARRATPARRRRNAPRRSRAPNTVRARRAAPLRGRGRVLWRQFRSRTPRSRPSATAAPGGPGAAAPAPDEVVELDADGSLVREAASAERAAAAPTAWLAGWGRCLVGARFADAQAPLERALARLDARAGDAAAGAATFAGETAMRFAVLGRSRTRAASGALNEAEELATRARRRRALLRRSGRQNRRARRDASSRARWRHVKAAARRAEPKALRAVAGTELSLGHIALARARARGGVGRRARRARRASALVGGRGARVRRCGGDDARPTRTRARQAR